MSIKNTGSLPRIYTCSDPVNRDEYIDIDYSALNLLHIPAITVTTDTNVNVYLSQITKKTARINFSQLFAGNVYYTVIGFN